MARILLIEDEDSVRLTLRKVLEADGHEVLEAANGEQALRLEESGPVDLVVTDIIMPEMDGFGAIHLLRKRDPDLAILAVTGGTADYLKAAKEKGAGEVLQKPFDNKTLLATVSSLLAAH
jgi:CheY-like chemotaxis protein